MKKEIKRIWGIFLILTLLLTTIGPVQVSSAELWASGKCGDDITWSIYSDGVFKLEGTGEMYDYAYDRVPWRFNYTNQIQKVEVSEGITYIGTNAFYLCHCIEKISLPSTLKKIGDKAFFMAEVFTEIDIPESVEEIGEYAFYDSSLEKIVLAENITIFGDWPVSPDCLDVTVETSKDISVYENYFVKDGESDSNRIKLHKIKTSQPVLVTNESGRDIYVDGVLVPTGTSVTSTAEEVTTEESTDDTTEEVTTQYGEGTLWDFDEETGTLTVYGDSVGHVGYFPEDRLLYKVRHIILAPGVESIDDTALYPNVEDVYISASVVNVYSMHFVSNSRNLKEINVSEDNFYYTSIDGNLYRNKNYSNLILDRYAPGKTEETFTLPAKAKGIDEDAFDDAIYLKEVTLHKGFSSITLPLSSYITRVDILNPDCTIIEDRDKSNLVVSSYKNSLVEEYCNEYGITFEEMTVPQPVKEITVSSGPDKSVFKKGTKAILGEVRIKVTFEDDTTQYMSSGYTITGIDTSTTGTKNVTVTFADKTCDFNVEVVDIEENEYIYVNTPKILPLNTVVDTKEIFFTAPVNGIYTVYSTGEYDTYAAIYTMNYGLLSYNDDSGDGNNFSINRQLIAGRTYIIEVTFYRTTTYTSDFALPEINVTLKELTGDCTHDYILEKVISSTCTSQGYSKYVCSVCGDIKKDNYVDKEEHDYRIIKVVEPTCEKEGYLIYRCNVCGYRTGMADKENPALGHTYMDIVIKPTITEYGYTLHECEICEYTYKSDWTNPLGFDVNYKDQETTEEVSTQEVTTEVETTVNINEKQTTQQTIEENTTSNKKIKINKPKVKAKRVKSKIKLTLSCTTKAVKYQIFVKKKGKYKLIKTTDRNIYKFRNKKKCYIKVRCYKTINNKKIYSKYRKLKVK